MKDAVLCYAGDAVPAARALGEGAALAASLADAGPRVAIYGAGLVDDEVALGAWQRRASLGLPPATSLVRRRTGGVACAAGDGIVYVALGLRTASELMPCPRDRVLNRNVRGLLAGLSAGGVPAHYFGRDVVSVAHRPVALVAWDRDADGRVLVEAFIARTRTIDCDGDATARAEKWRGKTTITLADAWSREPTAEEVVRTVAAGYARAALALRDVPRPVPPPRPAATDDDGAALRWSPRLAIPIGFLEAGLAVDDDGLVRDARLAGDFMQDRVAAERLRARLVGERAERATFARAINATYGATGDAVIEGTRTLETALDAFCAVA